MKTKKIILIFSAITAVVFLCGADTKNADAKKTKRNYKTANFFSATGDQTNADATADYTLNGYQYRNLYKKIVVPGLKAADPLPLRIYRKSKASEFYPEGSWTATSSYSISDGNVYLKYGSGFYSNSNWSYSTTFYGGDFRLFTYYGGKSTKKTKRQCAQTLEFSVSGDASNADASAVLSGSPAMTFHYRKISLPNLKLTNIPDYQAYKKDTYDPGLGAESWSANSIHFFSDGKGWVQYGYSNNGQFTSTNTGDFRLCFPEKISRSKSFAKRYIFSVSGDTTNADASFDNGFSTYYYRKVFVPGLKTDNELNMRLLKKANFVSGFSDEAWIGGSYYTGDGAIYIMYGIKMNSSDTMIDLGLGDYRLFVYK